MVRNFTILDLCCLLTKWGSRPNNHFPPFSPVLWFLSSLFRINLFCHWLLLICCAYVLLSGILLFTKLATVRCDLRVQRENIVDCSAIILDHVILLMQAKITLAFLAISLLCGFYWVFSQLQTSKSAEKSKKSIWKVTLQRLRALDFSCHFLPFVDSFFLDFVPGSGPRIHDIDNKY